MNSKRGISVTDAQNVILKNVTIKPADETAVSLRNCQNIEIRDLTSPADTFLHLKGSRSSNIKLSGNNLSNVEEKIVLEKEVPASAIIIEDPADTAIDPIEAPFDIPDLQRPVFPDRTFNIVDYGAKCDGTTKNTKAFNKAITACHKAGGGKVLVPEGKWLTGAIHLKSNVNLHFQKGAEIHFSADPKDYLPVVFTRWAGSAGRKVTMVTSSSFFVCVHMPVDLY